MNIIRQVVVRDAADLGAESAFWARVLDGRVVEDIADGLTGRTERRNSRSISISTLTSQPAPTTRSFL